MEVVKDLPKENKKTKTKINYGMNDEDEQYKNDMQSKILPQILGNQGVQLNLDKEKYKKPNYQKVYILPKFLDGRETKNR